MAPPEEAHHTAFYKRITKLRLNGQVLLADLTNPRPCPIVTFESGALTTMRCNGGFPTWLALF